MQENKRDRKFSRSFKFETTGVDSSLFRSFSRNVTKPYGGYSHYWVSFHSVNTKGKGWEEEIELWGAADPKRKKGGKSE